MSASGLSSALALQRGRRTNAAEIYGFKNFLDLVRIPRIVITQFSPS